MFQPQSKFVWDTPAIVNDLFQLVCHTGLLDSHMSTSYYSVRVKVLGYPLRRRWSMILGVSRGAGHGVGQRRSPPPIPGGGRAQELAGTGGGATSNSNSGRPSPGVGQGDLAARASVGYGWCACLTERRGSPGGRRLCAAFSRPGGDDRRAGSLEGP